MSRTMNRAREQRLRRQAAQKGLALHKMREGSRFYWQYGRYYLADPSTTAIVQSGLLDLDEVAEVLATA